MSLKQTREQILQQLIASYQRDPASRVSGSHLAEALGVSRTAIWKHIHTLQQTGVAIDAHSGSGYRLTTLPFHPAAIQSMLTTTRIGRQIMVLEETDSTNRDAMLQAEGGADEGLVIFANKQRNGKGRLGRKWHTLPESLAASVLLRPALPAGDVPQLSLLTAVALHEALLPFAPALRIKWPNDLLHNGAKLAGILTEMRAEPDRLHAVVLGFGINLAAPSGGWPSDIDKPCTDLATTSGSRVDKIAIAAACLNSLDRWYATYLADGFAPVRAAWWAAHAACHTRVSVHDGRHYIEGIARELDNDGALILETKQGVERIIAGDLELLA